jgi:hypothetical protein
MLSAIILVQRFCGSYGGSIDDLRIYDRALTQDEIEELS